MEIINPIQAGVERIDRIPAPVTTRVQPPVVQGIQVPVIDIPTPRLEYPRIELPRQESFNQEVPSKSEKQEEDKTEKNRELPISPVIKPQIQAVPQVPLVVPSPKSAETIEVQIAGQTLELPSPTTVVQASATAVVGTSATLVTALIFNQVRQAATPVVQKLVRDKFKIKLKVVKPVLHFVEENGKIHAIEYSADGVKIVNSGIENPEQYLRDLINVDPLFESDHHIVIDDPIKSMFTREGVNRFKYFVPPKKIAKKLSARFSI
jgi:hypothetical protein